jgi:PPOX class probable F420-dependent enzyme
MAEQIPPEARHLFDDVNYPHVSTVNEDGSPQSSTMWAELDGDDILVNTADGRVKTDNIMRDGRVSISVHSQENPYESLIISGSATMEDGLDADEHIDKLAKKYLDADSYPFRQEGEVRRSVRIKPEKVHYTNPG